MKKLSFLLITILAFTVFESTAHPIDDDPVENFSEKGIIVAINSFFNQAQDEMQHNLGSGENIVHRALVTSSGVYAFLETPENQKQLKDITPSTFVHLSGKLLTTGALLHIESIKKTDGTPDFDIDTFKNASGQPISLSGSNKCQCGLKVASLPSSCSLGHLHHLETQNGTIYNYLQNQKATDLFKGKGSHFKNVQVEALQFPGQYLLVKSVEIK